MQFFKYSDWLKILSSQSEYLKYKHNIKIYAVKSFLDRAQFVKEHLGKASPPHVQSQVKANIFPSNNCRDI